MEFIKKTATSIMSEQCFDNYFVEYHYLDGPCFKALLSQVVSLIIMAATMLMQVPQILKILENKSGDGIALTPIMVHLIVSAFYIAFNYITGFPFMAWGEFVLMTLQTAFIGGLILFYRGSMVKLLAFYIFHVAFHCLLCFGSIPLRVLLIVRRLLLPIFMLAKMLQTYEIYKNGSTGQLSGVTEFLAFATAFARIFTSIYETGDKTMIISSCIMALANSVTVGQMFYYRNKPSKKSITGGGKKTNGKADAAVKATSKKID